jgi:hypothetical protein
LSGSIKRVFTFKSSIMSEKFSQKGDNIKKYYHIKNLGLYQVTLRHEMRRKWNIRCYCLRLHLLYIPKRVGELKLVTTNIQLRRHTEFMALEMYATLIILVHPPPFDLTSPKTARLAGKKWTSFLPLGTTAQGELWPPEQFSFHGVRLSASRPAPNLEDQGIPLRLAPTPWPVRHGWSYQ